MSEKQTKEESNINVPYIVYEGALARMERTVKRLFILVIVTTLIAFVSNVVWLYWWNQYDYVTEDGYSRAAEDMAEQLRNLMQDAPDEQTRKDIQRLVTKIEGM